MSILQSTQGDLPSPRDCRDIDQWLQHYLDGELEPTLTTMVEKHLETCARCGREFDTYWRIKSALRDASSHSPELVSDQIALRRLLRFATSSIVTRVLAKRGR